MVSEMEIDSDMTVLASAACKRALPNSDGNPNAPSSVAQTKGAGRGGRRNQGQGAGTMARSSGSTKAMQPAAAAAKARALTLRAYNDAMSLIEKALGMRALGVVNQTVEILTLCSSPLVGCSAWVDDGCDDYDATYTHLMSVQTTNQTVQAHASFARAAPILIGMVHRWKGIDAEDTSKTQTLSDLSEEDVQELVTDKRTQTVMMRAKILTSFRDATVVKTNSEVDAMHNTLFELVSQDPFLAETITSPDTCATIGRVQYIRDVLLALQPNQESVIAMSDAHKDMIETVAEVARSLTVEVTQVAATAVAEEKALKDEVKAEEREQKRLEKVTQREKNREQKKQQKEELKKQQAADKAQKLQEQAEREAQDEAEAAKDGDPTGAKRGQRRRVRVAGAGDINAYDPTILRCKLPAEFHVVPSEELESFLKLVVANIDRVQCFKSKSTIKKVISAWPNMAKDTALGYTKKLQSDPFLTFSYILFL